MDGFHPKIIIIIHENDCVILLTWFHGGKWVQNIVPHGNWFKILRETWLCKVNGPKFLKKNDLGPSSSWQHGWVGKWTQNWIFQSKWAQVFLNTISPCSFIVQGNHGPWGMLGPICKFPNIKLQFPFSNLKTLSQPLFFFGQLSWRSWGQIAQEFENFLLGSVTKFPKESIGLIPIFLGEFLFFEQLAQKVGPIACHNTILFHGWLLSSFLLRKSSK